MSMLATDPAEWAAIEICKPQKLAKTAGEAMDLIKHIVRRAIDMDRAKREAKYGALVYAANEYVGRAVKRGKTPTAETRKKDAIRKALRGLVEAK
jgi:hypothetical protein